MIGSARLLMLGRQGSGKGTQCVRLAELLNVPHVSSGDVLRAAVRAPVRAAQRGPAHDALRDQERGGMRRAEAHDGDCSICHAGMHAGMYAVVLRLISKRARSFIEPAWSLDR